jgi:hypothetical protein
LEEWVDEWTTETLDTSLTVPALAEFTDMATRHPGYFGRHIPHTATTSTAKPRSTVRWTGSVEQWRSLVAAYFRAGDVDRAMRIMACESGGNPNADNPRSSAAGLFQHLGKYWASRSAAAGWAGYSIYHPEANVAVAAWLRDAAGWGSWVCR